MFSIHFAYPFILYTLIPVLCGAAWYRYKYYKTPLYQYPLTGILLKNQVISKDWKTPVFTASRLIVLLGLVLMIARPQKVDEQSKVMIEGIDIMLVLDVSGSMQLFDDPHDKRQRIDIAKKEAINFVNKRDNDPIGLVLFGQEAVSRCPLTLDKTVLTDIIKDIELGVIDPEGTALSKALITALKRLKNSTAKSKIIILLTDGAPSPGDLHPDDVVALAQKYGVKIYTIGIGGKYGGLFEHPMFGIQQAGVPLNTDLLEMFARKTNGKSFIATNQQELATIYNTIDQLEKTEHETEIYKNYHDIYWPYLAFLALLLLTELICATFIIRGLSV